MKTRYLPIIGVVAALCFQLLAVHAQEPTALDLQKRSFFHDREYFIVRSGRLQWIVQSDRADLGPAVTGYLLDATHMPQSAKRQAYNYTDKDCVRSSALQVVTHGGFPFTAFGQQTRCSWVNDTGVPEVEALWWAAGIRVSERFSGVANLNAIQRRLTLYGGNLHGEEPVTLRLRLPAGNGRQIGRALFVTHNTCPQALVVPGEWPLKIDAADGSLTLGPLTIAPGQTLRIDTYLLAQIPAGPEEDFVRQAARIEEGAQLEELRRQTKNLWDQTTRLETSDRVVRELFDHTRYAAFGAVSDAGHMRAGPFQYGAEWVRDSSQFTLGLISAGHFEPSRAVLDHVLRDMIKDSGTTMIAGGFDDPDREQFDQAGELLQTLRWYSEWAGDTSLIRQHRQKIIAMVERPLNPKFRDDTGLVHNRREFWEQTMNDAYELIYNAYTVVGLREAAAMAEVLGATDRKAHWLEEADRIWKAVLSHPTRSLVADGHLIKRRNVDGTIAEKLVNLSGGPDTPCLAAKFHNINPDATLALPVALRLVDPESELAKATLNEVEKLRDLRWFDGGYDRYDSTSSINNPGPWAFASCFVLRAQHEARQWDRSRATLEWLRRIEGGGSGSYYEEIPLYAREQDWLGLVSWTTGEIPFFFVRHCLGITFDGGDLVIRPALYPNSPPVKADLRYRKGRLIVEVDGSGPVTSATFNGGKVDLRADGSVRIPKEFDSGIVSMRTR